ncbi:MAG: YtxH domain-containing protein [Bacteroidota bacterium]
MNKVLIALLAGIAVGILIAPDKGSVTRKKLKDGFDELADELSGLKDKYLPGEDKRVYEKAFGDKKMSSYV